MQTRDRYGEGDVDVMQVQKVLMRNPELADVVCQLRSRRCLKELMKIGMVDVMPPSTRHHSASIDV